MISCFDTRGIKIAELNPTGPMAAVRKPLCESCDWLQKVDLECWHPSQKCATRTRPWQFSACPGDLWNARAANLHGSGMPAATLVLRIHGDDWTGNGQMGNLIGLALLARGIEFDVLTTSYDETRCPLPPEIKRRIVERATPGLPVLTFGSLPSPGALGAPNEALFTMWESTEAPADFTRQADGCRLVITTCDWCRETFARSTQTPIAVVPECIDPAAWPVRPMPAGPFTFLSAGRLAHGAGRKGLQTVVDAFLAEFPIENVRLRVKGWYDCPLAITEDPRIDITERYLTPSEMAEWYASGHVFVSAATAEGWGLHQTQAMATGRPLIAAPYSAMAEYLDKSTGYPVKYREVPVGAARGKGLYSGNWAEIDVTSLRARMRDAYHRRPDLLRRGAAAARKAREFSPDRTATGIIRAMHAAGVLRQKTFYHAGDIGDIIYSLPTIQTLGGGILYLGPEVRGRFNLHPREGCTRATCDSLRGLLEAQPYIHDVIYAPVFPAVDYDLNKFRLYWAGYHQDTLAAIWEARSWTKFYTLAWMHAVAFEIELDESKPWLSITPNGHHWKYLFARSARYHGKTFPWREIVSRFGALAAFVGTPQEHQDFCNQFGRVEYLPTLNFLALATYIADAQVFVGNASSPMAVAIGLGQRCAVECRSDSERCDIEFDRPNLHYHQSYAGPGKVLEFIAETPHRTAHKNITQLPRNPRPPASVRREPGLAAPYPQH